MNPPKPKLLAAEGFCRRPQGSFLGGMMAAKEPSTPNLGSHHGSKPRSPSYYPTRNRRGLASLGSCWGLRLGLFGVQG